MNHLEILVQHRQGDQFLPLLVLKLGDVFMRMGNDRLRLLGMVVVIAGTLLHVGEVRFHLNIVVIRD